MRFSPGVVAGFHWPVQMLSNSGDAVIVNTPVYYPFLNAVKNNDRRLICSDLICEDGIYRIDYEDKLVVSKSFNRDNKSIIKINYRNVSKMVLQSIMADLIDIHSQFETHSLFDAENHLIILDEFINQPLKKLFQTYSLAYRTYREINRDYQKALNEELSDEQLEFYQAQLAEINSLDLEELDEDELEREKKLLQSYEKTNEQISKYRQYMNGDRGALATLSNALSELEELNDNPQYQNTYERMYDLYYNLIDLDDEIINEFNSTNFDEYRLNEIQEVFFKLNRLKRKYGQSIEAIKEAKEDLEMKVAAFNNRETYLNDLKKGQTIFGWVHATQNRDITDKIINNQLTAYGWENMFEKGRHVFWQNNELAGEAAILHAFQCYGQLPFGLSTAIIGNGNTAHRCQYVS